MAPENKGKPTKKQAKCLKMVCMCFKEKKRDGSRNLVSAIFFSLSDNIHAILSEKMCKYRGIAPENDPCLYIDGKGGVSIIDSISHGYTENALI